MDGKSEDKRPLQEWEDPSGSYSHPIPPHHFTSFQSTPLAPHLIAMERERLTEMIAVPTRGTEEAHAFLEPCPDFGTALRSSDLLSILSSSLPHPSDNVGSSPPAASYVQYLDGDDWLFHHSASVAQAPPPADHPLSKSIARDAASSWKPIRVPSNWQLQGSRRVNDASGGTSAKDNDRTYDPPIYTNIQYPFSPVNPPLVPEVVTCESLNNIFSKSLLLLFWATGESSRNLCDELHPADCLDEGHQRGTWPSNLALRRYIKPNEFHLANLS